ncbi:MAG: DUF3244 domain-containing protein [Candidatus Cryptobacteroides sp.]
MKKKLLLLLLIALFTSHESVAFTTKDEDEEPIPIQEQSSNIGRIHRMPSAIAIECFYDNSTNCIYVSFNYPIGVVSILVINSDTGEVQSFSLNSECGCDSLYIGESTGAYSIQFDSSTGRHFYGEFTIA